MAVHRIHNEDWGFESNCFVCEAKNDRGLRIPYFHDDERNMVFAEFELTRDFSGAPNLVHGGLTLAILDEAMAWACIAVGHRWAVTSETATRFLGAVYVGKPYRVEAILGDVGPETMDAQAKVVDYKERVRAESTATFTVLGKAQAARAIGPDGLDAGYLKDG